MNQAHWHLLINHLPIIGTYFSTIVLISGLILKNQTVKITGLCLFVFTMFLALPALLTGEGAKDILNSIGLKNEYFISRHERLAQFAFWLSVSIGIFSLVALIAPRYKKKVQSLTIIVLIAGLGNSILMTAVGNSGGRIRHTEIRMINSPQTERDEK